MYVGPLNVLALATVIPAAIVALALLAYLAARGAARLHTAEVLRTE